jgi:hypothetical protein
MTAWKITLLSAAALLLLTAPAQSQRPIFEWPTWPPKYPKQHSLKYQQQVLPPKEFDHDYDGDLTIKHMDAAGIWEECRAGAKSHLAPPLACARSYGERAPSSITPMGIKKNCVIFILTEPELAKRGWSYDIVMRHEIGHCNGWHHD